MFSSVQKSLNYCMENLNFVWFFFRFFLNFIENVNNLLQINKKAMFLFEREG